MSEHPVPAAWPPTSADESAAGGPSSPAGAPPTPASGDNPAAPQWPRPAPGYPPYGWGSPWGPPPPPPPSSTLGYPAAPGPQGRRSRLPGALIAGAVAIALVAGGVGAGVGLALRGQPVATTSQPSSTSGGSQPVSGTANAASIAAAIDPSIVDINDTIDGTPAAGTGIVITSGGEVLTNNHVIDGATNITAQVDGQGPTYSVKVLGYDNVHDVALLQIENAPTLKAAPIGNSSVLQVGDQVVALGNALGKGGTPAVATGTVTGLDQTVTANEGLSSETLTGTIQVQVDIVPGDSGGPLVDAAGQVVGMDTAGSSSGNPVASGDQSGATTGFAIPIDTAMSIAHQIQSGTSSATVVVGGSGPLIGVDVQNAASAGSPAAAGALIVQVVAGTPAAQAGLQAGDVIVSFDGQAVTSAGDLSTALRGERPGQTAQLGWVDTSGVQHTSSITLAAGPPN